MDFTLSTLGCASVPVAMGLFSPRRRQLARTDSHKSLLAQRVLKHRDSFSLYKLHDQDDDTASTLSITSSSSCEDYDESCSLLRGVEEEYSNKVLVIPTKKQVHFAATLVTEVHTRPLTTREDKYYLHYNEHDYVDFKIEFLTGRSRSRKVSFARDVVSTVHSTTPTLLQHKTDLFYTEAELQGFLDDFVSSLNQKFSR